ncbi:MULTISPECIES: hypothetical protein [Actinopolyspora]|uniref:DUF8129 domain-containing protein n=1 Tax=Actinopolyspora saharensis TaxID=995062 RepID=A0A1H1ENB6_9ACTN|nr:MULTISPECIES: hypothetical protein [Actinopolyspora]NHD18147.1 hypothetical protein [Actinopolyspora sp. BKK2]NHE77176.1 hypothetical protein [Actinopolyspora sp. BKK1]SDQ90070.1 hypothetical protein SAMN04489718_2611 [Actinopolyspora saharensis]
MTEQLPIPEFDELPLTTMQHRIRSLEEEQLNTLVEHERAHADRPQVLELLNTRLEELRAGATPTEGGEGKPADQPEHGRGGSDVTPKAPRSSDRPTMHGTSSRSGYGIEHR